MTAYSFPDFEGPSYKFNGNTGACNKLPTKTPFKFGSVKVENGDAPIIFFR